MKQDRIEQQLDLFASVLEQYKITKPIRLIELFAGVGSQFKALKLLTKNVESYKICEWAYNSIVALMSRFFNEDDRHANIIERYVDEEILKNQFAY